MLGSDWIFQDALNRFHGSAGCSDCTGFFELQWIIFAGLPQLALELGLLCSDLQCSLDYLAAWDAWIGLDFSRCAGSFSWQCALLR
jgi:hypothetical protein